MGVLRCPRCGRSGARRTHRVGVVERVLSVVYVYPFLCQDCARRFLALQWGTRYAKQPAGRHDVERVAVLAPLVVVGTGARVEGEVSDLSLQGCTARTRVRLREGATVRLELQLEPVGPPVVVAAALVRSVRSDAVRLDFIGVSPDEQLRIHRVLVAVDRVQHDGRVPPAPQIRDERFEFLRSPGFWLTILLLVLAALVLTVLIPTFSRCVWGENC